MNNADKPINAIVDMYGHAVDKNDFNAQSQKLTDKFSGLTKREHFAGLAMQGILSSLTEKGSHGIGFTMSELEYMADSAINMSDALLKRLEK